MSGKLIPYTVKLSKTVEQDIVIYAKDSVGLADVAQTMCESGQIQIDDDAPLIETLMLGKADEKDIEALDCYTFSFESEKRKIENCSNTADNK